MSLTILFHFLCAHHVSDINISIIRSLRLFCWITTLVVLFWVRCVLEFRCGWVGVVSVLQAEACNTDTTPFFNYHNNDARSDKHKLFLLFIFLVLSTLLSVLLHQKEYDKFLRSRDRVSLYIIIIKPTRCTNSSNLFWNKTLHVSDSSSVHHQEFFTVNTAMVYVIQILLTVLQFRPDPARKLSANCMTYTIAVCTVKNSWWWTEELSEICRVLFQ